MFCFTWNLFFLVNFCIADDPLFAPRIIDTRHNIQDATIKHRVVTFFFPFGFARKQRAPFFWFVARLLHFASANPLLLSELDRICRRIIDSFTPQLAYFLRFWCIANKKTTTEWRAHTLWKLLFCSMTQIKPKTNRTIVATHCFCCCSLRLQEYRRTHSPAPPLFVLPLKQSADTSALSARFDRIFALSNSVFHVKHRFFYCFSVGILLFLLLRILLVFFALFCFVELSGVFD